MVAHPSPDWTGGTRSALPHGPSRPPRAARASLPPSVGGPAPRFVGLIPQPAGRPAGLATAKARPREIPVPRLGRDIRVKIASERGEWRDAFRLVSSNYQACGYEAPHASKVRFTP